MGATREQLLRAMRRRGACAEARAWVLRTPGKPRELWGKCTDSAWLYWLVTRLAYGGGGRERFRVWLDFLDDHCSYIQTCDCGCGARAPIPSVALIRKHVPWHMVDAAIQREGSQ